MVPEHELSQFQQFLRGCMEELINCYGSPEWIEEELLLAQWVYPSLSPEVFLESWAWVEGAARTKERKRGVARKKLAVVLAYELSKRPPGGPRLDEEERQRRLEEMSKGWISVSQLVGMNLTQIEACRLVLKLRCSCDKNCHTVNFTRDWKDLQRACQQQLEALKGEGSDE